MPFFLPELKKQGFLDSVDMMICNVGSRKHSFGDDYGDQRGWKVFSPNLTIIGFDADETACEAANAEFGERNEPWNEFHFPYAIAQEQGNATLYVTKAPMCSSLYPPNEKLLSLFPRLQPLVSMEKTLDVATINLDEFCKAEEIAKIQFLQVDVQGAELQVLKGATDMLSAEVLAAQLEVGFSPLYKDQPLFGDIDQYMRSKGFVLFDFESVGREVRRQELFSRKRCGQILWADAIYLRDPWQLDSSSFLLQDPQKLFELACIADLLELTDYALSLLEWITLNHGADTKYNYANAVVESLTQVETFQQQGIRNTEIARRLQDYLR